MAKKKYKPQQTPLPSCGTGYKRNNEGNCVKTTAHKIAETVVNVSTLGITGTISNLASKATERAIKKSKPQELKIRRARNQYSEGK